MPELPLEVDCHWVHAKRQADGELLLVDCREPDEHATANISGAMLLPMSQITDRVGELSEHKHRPLVVHCHHGGRSLRVVRWLREQGFDTAQSMAGGIDRWSLEIDGQVPRY